MKQYLDLLRHIKENGRFKEDRTGTGTISVFGYQMRFDLSAGFPMVTTKKLHLRSIIHELLWFLRGETNNEILRALDVSIWNDWALPEDEVVTQMLSDWERVSSYAKLKFDGNVNTAVASLDTAFIEYRQSGGTMTATEHGHQIMDDALVPREVNRVVRPKGDLGPIYGKQWRSWEGPFGTCVDQIKEAIHTLRTNPTSRRIIVSAWNVVDLPRMALQPCHTMFQFYSEELTEEERWDYQLKRDGHPHRAGEVREIEDSDFRMLVLDELQIPRYRLSCQLYQRSLQSALAA